MKKMLMFPTLLLVLVFQAAYGTGTGTITKNGTAVCKTPDGDITGTLAKGATVTVSDVTIRDERGSGRSVMWFNITASGKITGWVSGYFLRLPGKSSTPSINVTNEGIGGIGKETPFTCAAIRKIFPEFNVHEDTAYTEGLPYPTIVVHDGDSLILTINPNENNRIFCVVIENPMVKSQLGGAIDDTYESVFGESDPARICIPLEEELSGKVSCKALGTNNYYFVFSGVWSGPDGQIPPFEELKNWKVEKIAWIAP